ncbi:MAG: hypothetical protein Q9174_005131, partial [Haloplaca sp. 1 TL-2023]
PNRVTVMGESAGGASILFQMTAFGGSQGPAPFQQAVVQSPAWVTDLGVKQQQDTLTRFLTLLNVSNIQEARQLDSAILIGANQDLVGNSDYGTFIIDPVVDGSFVPAQPGHLLKTGAFDHGVRVMNGHQANEGLIFTRPYVRDDTTFIDLVRFWIPNANTSVISFISDELYPAVFDGSLPYRDQPSRAILFVSEHVVTCHTDWLNRAYLNQTFAYQFSVPPGVHAQDTDYTFYNGPGTPDVYMSYNSTVALALQRYITAFATGILTSGEEVSPPFPRYGHGVLLNLTSAGLLKAQDSTANKRWLLGILAAFLHGWALDIMAGPYGVVIRIAVEPPKEPVTNNNGDDGPLALSKQRNFRPKSFAVPYTRNFINQRPLKRPDVHPTKDEVDPQQLAHTVTRARQAFGDTLPEDFLSSEEYKVYERLYGTPAGVTKPQDVGMLQDMVPSEEDRPVVQQNTLMSEDEHGNLEEVATVARADPDPADLDGEQEELVEETVEIDSHVEGNESSEESLDSAFDTRFARYRDKVAASGAMSEPKVAEESEDLDEEADEASEEAEESNVEEEDADAVEAEENAYSNDNGPRRHPLTVAGKWGTSPSTIQLPTDTFVNPISAVFSKASNKHLSEVTLKTFGGRGLPNSTATPSPKSVGEALKQSPIALEATQSHMGDMEANAYLAAIMPGAFATASSCLVEIRKRLGPQWLQGLLKKEGGPRVLDAGAGGAGVLAWRELLRTEWELMHPEADLEKQRVPFGKSTVVTGSTALRQRSSALLDNTTFLPRLPDYHPQVDHPSLEESKGTPRKQYDVILAPYTLWTLQEDHMRKAHIQNLWSLLKPDGGVLIVIEKGVPRGFELVAGGRQVLLKNHISSPGSTHYENRIDGPSDERLRQKETGMIIAPCTNHGKCPMYLLSGKTVGRKDFCHFSQRYIRPSFLQRILGQGHRNHEDIRFSFVAVQRGVDQRQVRNIQQGQEAGEAAFAGHDEIAIDQDDAEVQSNIEQTDQGHEAPSTSPDPLSFPRILLRPLKKQGHIIFDACTPAGKLERWTVPRSFSQQAYSDARKARWGDLWALGAKTRIPSRLRIGREQSKGKVKQRKRVNINIRDSDESIENGLGRESSGKKKKGKGMNVNMFDLDNIEAGLGKEPSGKGKGGGRSKKVKKRTQVVDEDLE